MRCDDCERLLQHGDEVTKRQPGAIIDGKFEPVEEATVSCYPYCPEEEE